MLENQIAGKPILLAFLLVICGCQPLTPSRVRVIHLDDRGNHSLENVVLSTLPSTAQNWQRLQSNAISFRGGGRLVVDGLRFQQLPTNSSAEKVRDLTREDPGQPVSFSYLVESDVAVATDYQSLLMASAYHGVEQAREFFWEYDTSLATRSSLEVCFNCGLYIDSGLVLPFLVSDNAAYVPFADQFVFLPDMLLTEIPIAANAAVLCHEYSHRVFRYNVFSDEAFGHLLRIFTNQDAMTEQDQQSYNLLLALNEGSADYFAAVFANNPGFVDASLGDLGNPDDRNLEGDRATTEQYDSTFDEAAKNNQGVRTGVDGNHQLTADSWNPYHLGTIWAGALWRIGLREGSMEMEIHRLKVVPAVISAMKSLGDKLQFDFGFEYGDMIVPLLEALPADQRSQACIAFGQSFATTLEELAVCH